MDRPGSGGRRLAFVRNPHAGKGRNAGDAQEAVGRLRRAGFEVVELQGADAESTLAQAREAVAGGLAGLVVCGGDGTAHLGVQAVAGTEVPLGVVPTGTGNDLARYLDVPRGDASAAVDRIIAGRTRTLDLARTGSRFFVTVMAAGFDAVVNERANTMTWPRGQMRYNIATLAELRTFAPIPYTLDLDGEIVQTEAMLVAVGNGPSFGGGLRIAEGALLDDGLLDVIVIGRMSKTRLVRTYPKLFKGSHTGEPEFTRHRVTSVTIAAPGIVAYADGERFGPLPLTIHSAPRALKVFA